MDSKSCVGKVSKKHDRDSENESDDNDDQDPGALAQLTRSQRKCQRERRRRSEVNKGFDDLTSLLWDIDAETMRTEIENRSLRGKKQANLPTEEIVLSRVDLINCTISLLRRLHAENEQRKEIISTLTRAGTSGFDTGLLTLPNLRNVTASLDNNNDRARLVNTEGLLHGMVPRSSNTFQGGPLDLPLAAIDSQNLFQHQSLLDQQERTQRKNSAILSRSIQEVLNSVYSPQTANSSDRKEPGGLVTTSAGIPNTAGNRNNAPSNESALLHGMSNSDVIATFLARQQHNRNVSNYLSNNDNIFGGNSAIRDSAAMPMHNVLPTPVPAPSNDASLQLLQLLQNRQINARNNTDLARIEALLQQQLQQKPRGR